MSVDEKQLRQIEEWNFLPDTFRCWIERAKAPTAEGHIWNQYMDLMWCFVTAFARAPLTAEECEKIDINAHFKAEVDHLTVTAQRLLHQEEGISDVDPLA